MQSSYINLSPSTAGLKSLPSKFDKFNGPPSCLINHLNTSPFSLSDLMILLKFYSDKKD